MDPDPLVGRVLAQKMQLQALLGEGAMGKVYRAHHTGLDKTVAIKVLHPEAVASPTIALRFQSEAQTASRLDHPNSLRVLDFGVDGDDRLLYIAMEFLEGRTFRDVLAEEGRVGPPRMAWIVGQVCSALAAAHDQGVIHRDVKPENIMLSQRRGDRGPIEDFVKVCDFGLAKVLDAPADPSGRGPLTQHGTVLGTPAYMSPEQAKGEGVDHRADLYSVGVMMYRALCGTNPFTGESAWAVSLKQIAEMPPPLLERAPNIDPRLAAIVHKALEKEPADRFQSARELKQAIEDVVGAPDLASDDSAWRSAAAHSEPELAPTYISPLASAPIDESTKRSSIPLWAGAAFLLVAAGLIAAVAVRQPEPTVEALPVAPPMSRAVVDTVAPVPDPDPLPVRVAEPTTVSKKKPSKKKKKPTDKKKNSERGHDRNALEDPF